MTVYYKEEPRFVDIPDSMEELEEEVKRAIGPGDMLQEEKMNRVMNIFVTLYRDNRFKDIESLLKIHFPEMGIKDPLDGLNRQVKFMLSNPDYAYVYDRHMTEQPHGFTGRTIHNHKGEVIMKPNLSVKEVATRLSVTEETVRRWCRSGDLGHFKIGNTLRVQEVDLMEYIDNLYRPRRGQ